MMNSHKKDITSKIGNFLVMQDRLTLKNKSNKNSLDHISPSEILILLIILSLKENITIKLLSKSIIREMPILLVLHLEKLIMFLEMISPNTFLKLPLNISFHFNQRIHLRRDNGKIRAKDELKFNSQELQKSHHVFGKQDVPWVTSAQSAFTSRDMGKLRFKIEKPKNSLNFGNLKNDYISTNFENFVPHNPKMNIINKEQAQELRKHHFIFGTDTNKTMVSSSMLNYQKPRSVSNFAPTVSSHLLRQSHFSLGQDRSINPSEHYMSTYMQAMKLK